MFFFYLWIVFLLVSWQFLSAKPYDGDQTSAMCSLTQIMPKLTSPLIIQVLFRVVKWDCSRDLNVNDIVTLTLTLTLEMVNLHTSQTSYDRVLNTDI